MSKVKVAVRRIVISDHNTSLVSFGYHYLKLDALRQRRAGKVHFFDSLLSKSI